MPNGNEQLTNEEVVEAITKAITTLQKPDTIFEKYFKPIMISLIATAVVSFIGATYSFVKMETTLGYIEKQFATHEEVKAVQVNCDNQIKMLENRMNNMKADANFNVGVIADKLKVQLKKLD